CQMSGSLYGVFEAAGWVFNQGINAVDADAWAVLNDNKTVAANDVLAQGSTSITPPYKNLGDRALRYEAHLIVLGQQRFQSLSPPSGNEWSKYERNQATAGTDYAVVQNVANNTPVSLGSAHTTWNLPDPAPEIPFTIGPIPCYISGFAELALDVDA